MNDASVESPRTRPAARGHAPHAREVDCDAVVIGAGFGGLRMLHELRQRGLSARVIEAGSDVGGTWYYNRYPGARTDSQAWLYAYSFSQEIQDNWDWSERYPGQAEALAYLQYVADYCDMRRDIRFNTRVTQARYDERNDTWQVATSDGATLTCSYLVTATGPLSTPYKPDFPGIDEFRGKWYLTGNWPKEPVSFSGKRVAVIGTGATAVQAIPLIAQTAAAVTVFQRTPNYVLPARNAPLTDYDREAYRRDYDAIWARTKSHVFAFDFAPAGRNVTEVDEHERQRILERYWEIGSFRFLFETFDDIFADEAGNAIVAEFVRNKIRAIVEDPATAELLCPKDHPLGAKRPPLGHFYYETYNRDNVRLVSVRDNPITGISADGVMVGDTEYPADIIVFATGFDAVTGTLNQIDIRGRDGVALGEHWAGGPQTYLGICVDGFPNMFMVSGPQSPFANIPVVIDGCVDWIGRALGHLRDNRLRRIEPTPAAVTAWGRHMDELVNLTVLPRAAGSWFMGGNIPGKPRVVLFYFGGAGAYRDECNAAAERGFEGFTLA
ncbi:MAG: NAD(P)/FAD-dependent oxidoreductase [Gammaproteobacteria bacterium]